MKSKRNLGQLDTLPEGWIPLNGASTAPTGWKWYSNGKSLWDDDYRYGLVKEENIKNVRSD